MTAEELYLSVVFVITRARNVVSILYLCIRSGTVDPGVFGHDIVLDASILITVPWFLVVVYWGYIVRAMVMDVGILGLIYCGIRAGTVAPGVSGRNITLAASIWRTDNWFLLVVAWIHGVWLVVVDVGVL